MRARVTSSFGATAFASRSRRLALRLRASCSIDRMKAACSGVVPGGSGSAGGNGRLITVRSDVTRSSFAARNSSAASQQVVVCGCGCGCGCGGVWCVCECIMCVCVCVCVCVCGGGSGGGGSGSCGVVQLLLVMHGVW
jgi:hypothetical protein